LIQEIGKVKLYILNWYDIIITKIARSEPRDIEDCIAIIKSKKLKLKELKERYFEIAEVSLITNFKEKFAHLESKLK
jgi:hypothetical protein